MKQWRNCAPKGCREKVFQKYDSLARGKKPDPKKEEGGNGWVRGEDVTLLLYVLVYVWLQILLHFTLFSVLGLLAKRLPATGNLLK